MISFAQTILPTTTTLITRRLILQKAIQKGGGKLGLIFFQINKDYPKNTS